MPIEKRVKREQPASIRIVRNVEATGVPEQHADSKFQFGDGGMIFRFGDGGTIFRFGDGGMIFRFG
jgi:hypothetical protein